MGRHLMLISWSLVAACGGRPSHKMGLEASITWEPEVTARCFKLRLFAEGVGFVDSNPLPRRGKSSLSVGVARVDLPQEVQLQALGFRDDACEDEPSPQERSPVLDVQFEAGVQKVTLHVVRRLTSDAGAPDAGAPDAGAPDAGAPDAGASDAGAPDAGASDAGPPDAGSPERCANRIDDDGDMLVDCADPDCPTNASCDDGNLCTSTDRCTGARTCMGQAVMCMGPVPACTAPSGCNAGVCTAAPLPARTFCDGGQCDGVGRCAPFCDPLAQSLAGCWRFENDFVDSTGKGANGVALGGRFRAGARGLAYEVLDGGVWVGDHTSLDCINAITLEAWVRLTAVPPDGGRFGVLDNDGQYGVFIGPSGTLRCSTGLQYDVGAVPLNAWHHVGCIFDSFTARAYIDGVFVGAIDAGLPDGGPRRLSTGNDAGLSLGQNTPSGDLLQGAVDGVRIWCEARSPLDFCAARGECG